MLRDGEHPAAGTTMFKVRKGYACNDSYGYLLVDDPLTTVDCAFHLDLFFLSFHKMVTCTSVPRVLPMEKKLCGIADNNNLNFSSFCSSERPEIQDFYRTA